MLLLMIYSVVNDIFNAIIDMFFLFVCFFFKKKKGREIACGCNVTSDQ